MRRDLRLSTLTYTLFVTFAAVDRGHLSTITFDEFYTGLDAQTLFEDIEKKVGKDIDLSLVTHQLDQKKLFLEALESTRAALEGRERRKTGLQNSGLLLLCAYIAEIVQHYGWDTSVDRKEMDAELS